MYEIYREVKTREKYYETWDKDNVAKITEDLLEEIYQKYVVKCRVLQRDGFKCQNLKCSTPQSTLTLHHVKWRKNGGEDKVRNGVTLCRTCHASFHKAKNPLIFPEAEYLPPHIRGHTFKLELPDKGIDWKQLKFEMKGLRKKLKHQGFKPMISWERASLLLQWLFSYTEDSEYDD